MIQSKKYKKKLVIPSVLSPDMHIYGDIEGEGALEINGRVTGDIKCLSVVIGEGALIKGDVLAEKIEIYGEVVGEVKGRYVKCGSTAKIIGNITHIFIEIENGAYLDGSCRKHMQDDVRLLPSY
jgi:cytoskeletal protein CcmA (bactofilin family)